MHSLLWLFSTFTLRDGLILPLYLTLHVCNDDEVNTKL